jgi:hypothetical protein
LQRLNFQVKIHQKIWRPGSTGEVKCPFDPLIGNGLGG